MIYLDNGATSFPKPKGMVAAMEDCILRYCGNPGRSGHQMSMKTGEEIYQARRVLAELFQIPDAERLVFTKNTTEALNLGIRGFLRGGDHVVTTSMEHNSVLRPLKFLERKNITHTILKGDFAGKIQLEAVKEAMKPNTRLIIMTAASNVTGTKMPLKEVGQLAKERGICFMVDGAQGAGSMDLNVTTTHIDMLAFPGHKGLLGPQGIGGLYVREGVHLEPLIQGGTGTESKSRVQPETFPEGYESGTVNSPAIVGLGYGAKYIASIGVDVIRQYEEELICHLEEGLYNMEGIRIYGPRPEEKTGITLFNLDRIGAEEVTERLNRDYQIAVRGGYHCAGLAHKTIGTWGTGAVRVSVGPYNSKKDILALVDAIYKMKKEKS